MSTPTNQIDLPRTSHPAAPPPPPDPKLVRRAVRILAIVGIVVVVLVVVRLVGRYTAERHLEVVAQGDQAAQVVVVRPKVSAAVEQLVLPANVQAFVEAPIYARTDGYLKKWYFDIGAHVKAGDLLAEIESPEGDLQLAQARADLKAVQANAELAGRTAERWEALLKKNAVSQQETDQALSDLSAKQAAADASAANVRRLEQLQDYEKVYAPFDGVVTARDTDVGALIAAASSPKPLFHVAAVDKLRVYAAVPEVAAAAVKNGADVTLTLDQFPNRVFHGKIARDSGAIDPATRTLNVEVDIDNAAGELLPGSYGFLHIGIPARQAPLILPSNTLIFRTQGLQAAVVRDGHAVLVPIKIGHDFGDTVEVTSGVTAQDQVILDPPDSIADGTPVEMAPAK
jgi:RND family efflux transporter MFP subunit